MSEGSIDAADSISVRGMPVHTMQGVSTTTITGGGGGGLNSRSEQHLSYFHFESTDTLVQSKTSMMGWWLEGLGVLGGLVCVVGMFAFPLFPCPFLSHSLSPHLLT